MKYILAQLLICSLLIAVNCSKSTCQLIIGGINSPAYKMVTQRPILILESDDELLDEILEDAFAKYWTLTSVTFIDRKEISKYDFNKEYNLLIPIKQGSTTFSYKNYGDEFKPRGLAMLVSMPSTTHMQTPILVMDSPKNEFIEGFADESLSLYDSIRISYMVGGMSSMYEVIEKYKLEGKTTTSYFDMYENFSKIKAKPIAKKTLIILEEMTQPQGENKIVFLNPDVLKSYPYKYKLVSLEEFNNLSKEDNPDYCFMDLVINDLNYVFVYDVATKAMLYGDMKADNDGCFDAKYFERLVKAITN